MRTSDKTISQAFEDFLTDQKARLSPATFSKYETIIRLFESYMESYWPGHDQDEYKRVHETGGTFCGTFSPHEIISGYSEFLGYFMPHKVMCGKETMQAAGTVTKKLAKWLADKGYAEDTLDAQDRAQPSVAGAYAGARASDPWRSALCRGRGAGRRRPAATPCREPAAAPPGRRAGRTLQRPLPVLRAIPSQPRALVRLWGIPQIPIEACEGVPPGGRRIAERL